MAFFIGVSLTENYRIANSIIGIRPQAALNLRLKCQLGRLA